MKKRISILVGCLIASVVSAEDLRHGISIGGAAVMTSYSSGSSSFASPSLTKNNQGFQVFGDFIVNDGLIFGDAGYMDFKYESSTATESNSDSLSDSIFSVSLREYNLNRYSQSFVGIVVEQEKYDSVRNLNKYSVSSLNMGLTSGYKYYFKSGVGLGVEAAIKTGLRTSLSSSSIEKKGSFNSLSYSISTPIIYRMSPGFELFLTPKYSSFNSADSIDNQSSIDSVKIYFGLNMKLH